MSGVFICLSTQRGVYYTLEYKAVQSNLQLTSSIPETDTGGTTVGSATPPVSVATLTLARTSGEITGGTGGEVFGEK